MHTILLLIILSHFPSQSYSECKFLYVIKDGTIKNPGCFVNVHCVLHVQAPYLILSNSRIGRHGLLGLNVMQMGSNKEKGNV